MSFSRFMDYFVEFFLNFYGFTDSIYPFTDFPTLSLFWLFSSLVLTNLAWQLFPSELMDNFGERFPDENENTDD